MRPIVAGSEPRKRIRWQPMTGTDAPFLRTLCSLRWLAVAGQAATILVASWVLGLELPQLPLWSGVLVLILFNLYAQLRVQVEQDQHQHPGPQRQLRQFQPQDPAGHQDGRGLAGHGQPAQAAQGA